MSPLLILLNKQDLVQQHVEVEVGSNRRDNGPSPEEETQDAVPIPIIPWDRSTWSTQLDLERVCLNRPFHLQRSIATTGEGVYQGLTWLCDTMDVL